MISIILNGEPRQVREGSIADLVASLGLDVKKVAVERKIGRAHVFPPRRSSDLGRKSRGRAWRAGGDWGRRGQRRSEVQPRHCRSVAALRAPPIWAARQKAKRGGFQMISIILNGEPRQVREGSIADLVASLGLDVKKVAVERNRGIVPRSTLADVALAEGDALEIVHFVGGG